MKSKYVLIAFVLFCCSCQELIMKNRPFPAVDAGRIEIVPISEEKRPVFHNQLLTTATKQDKSY